MSSIEAVETAASTRIPAEVISRETAWTGGIVKIKVPVEALEGSYPKGEENVIFLQFSHNVPGGRVNIFVHTPDLEVRGRSIKAEASVLKKRLKDGSEFLYVDLVPVHDERPVTHRMAVMSKGPGSWDNDAHLVFATPGSIRGLIIFGPPEVKMVPQEPARSKARNAQASPAKDAQLERYYAQGWKFDREDGRTIHLYREVGGKRKELTHQRRR